MILSVVTVCFNSENTIRSTIDSFVSQTHDDKELLIIDGGSRDSTLDVVRSYRSSNIRVVSEPDDGVFDAMNKGLRLFLGDAVGFLNSDDTFHDDGVLAAVADALGAADIAYGDLLMVTDHASKEVVREWRAGPYSPELSSWGGSRPTPASLSGVRSLKEPEPLT